MDDGPLERRPEERHPNDIYDEIETAWLRVIAKHVWSVAEYCFKLTGWLFVSAAVVALGQKENAVEIKIAGAILTAVWFAAAIATIFKAIGYVQDAARDCWLDGRDRHSFKTLVIDFAITAATVMPLVQLFTAALSVAAEVVSLLSNAVAK